MSLPLPVLPKPSGCSPSFFSFVFASSDSCFLRSSTIFSNFLIRSSRAFSSAIASSGMPPRRQAEMAPMIARRFIAFLRVENVIAIRSQLLSQKKLALPERDDVGGHDLEIHRTANRIHRGGAFAAVQVLPGGQDHGIEVLRAAELASN